jgi:hypothetical protein
MYGCQAFIQERRQDTGEKQRGPGRRVNKSVGTGETELELLGAHSNGLSQTCTPYGVVKLTIGENEQLEATYGVYSVEVMNKTG